MKYTRTLLALVPSEVVAARVVDVCVLGVVITVPLGLWKLGELILWVYNHIRVVVH